MRKLVAVAMSLGLLAAMALSPSAMAQQSTTVNLATLNDSGVSGTATLTAMGEGTTQVVVQVGDGGNANMPAHIHEGSCPDVGGVKFPLSNVMNGQSTTEVKASLSDLTKGGLAINLHKSPDDIKTYTACGNIAGAAGAAPAAAPAAQPATAGGPAVALVAGLLATAGAGLAGAGMMLRRRRS